METTIPQATIQEHVEAVEWPPHREHLHQKIGSLAEMGARGVEIEDQPDVLHDHSEMLAGYFAKASSELPEGSFEDQVWDKVFNDQMYDLRFHKDLKDNPKLMLNILIGNQLAVHDIPEEGAEMILTERMWYIATTRKGLAMMATARENNGICVNTGNEDKPFASITEQFENHGGLLMALDEAVDLSTTGMPIYEIATASIDQQVSVVRMLYNAGNITNFAKNVELVPDKRSLALHLATGGLLKKDLFDVPSISEVITFREAVDYAIAKEDSFFNPKALAELPTSDQLEVFASLLDSDPEALEGMVGYHAGSFTSLGKKQMDILIDRGIIGPKAENTQISNFDLFTDLPEGTMEEMLEKGVEYRSLFQCSRGLSESDNRKLIKKAQQDSSWQISEMFEYAENFSFLSVDDIHHIADASGNIFKFAQNIDKFTDGSNQELIEKIIVNGQAISLATVINQMPALDHEWFVSQLEANGQIRALTEVANVLSEHKQDDVFRKCMMSGDEGDVRSLRMNLDKFDKLNSHYVLEVLSHALDYETIVRNLEYFEGETEQTIFNRISQDHDALKYIAQNLYQFDFVDRDWLFGELVSLGETRAIVSASGNFLDSGIEANDIFTAIENDPDALSTLSFSREVTEKIGVERVYGKLMSTEEGVKGLQFRIDTLVDYGLYDQYVDTCIENKYGDYLGYVLRKNGATRDIVEKCCAAGWEEPLVQWHEYATEADNKSVVGDLGITREELEQWGAHAVLLTNTDRYPGVDTEKSWKALFETGDEKTVIKLANHFSIESLPAEVADYLVDKGATKMLGVVHEKFEPSVFTSDLMARYSRLGDPKFVAVYEYSGQSIDWIDKTIDVFGSETSSFVFAAVETMYEDDGKPTIPILTELGVTKKGQAGIEQLRRVNSNIRHELVYGSQSNEDLSSLAETLTDNPIAMGIAQQLTRFNASQWGQSEAQEWKRIFSDHLAVRSEIAPLKDTYKVSEEFTVRTIDAKEFDASKIDEDAAKKYEVLRSDVDEAFKLFTTPGSEGFSRLFSDATDLIDTDIERLQKTKEKLVEQGKQKAIDGITSQINRLQGVREMSTKEFLKMTKDNFAQIADVKVKGLDQVVRTGIFLRAMRKSPAAAEIAENIHEKPADFKNLVALDDFIEHIVNNEVYGNYFSNDDAKKDFMRYSDTTAIRKQIAKTQQGATSGQTALQFIPSRGPLLELSGHIGDACWASKYESIAKEFPNMTAIAYMKNPGKNTERLVGAGMMIETKDTQTGEDIVLIRGTNPIENYINGVKVDDFYAALTTYAKQVAGDRKVAIVIDGGPGQAATNRPLLHGYLKDTIKPDLENTNPLVLAEDSTFNGYQLTAEKHPVYYINS